MANRVYASIPEPVRTVDSLHSAVQNLKENVEIMTGQRGPQGSRGVTFDDLIELGVVTSDQVRSYLAG